MRTFERVVLHRVRRAIATGDKHWIAPERRIEAIVSSEVYFGAWRARRNCGLPGRRVTAVALLGRDSYTVRPPGFKSAGSALRAIASGRLGFLGCTPRTSSWSGGSHARAVWRPWRSPSEMRLRRALNNARTAKKALALAGGSEGK